MYDLDKMVPLEKFLPELRFEFQDLPDELFRFAIVRAAQTMAREGDVDVRRVTIPIERCVTRYALHVPCNYELVNILGIQLDDHSCRRRCDKPLNVLYHKPADKNTFMYDPVVWFDDVEQVLFVHNILPPAELKINLTVCPPAEVCELPYLYYDLYADLLTIGVKSNIMRMLNKPWTNLQLAMAYDRAFQRGINDITVKNHLHKTKSAFKMSFGKVL